ncbi:hypothetical protein JWZ97_03365 [Methylococcus sp. EFPC2]|nr:hypothetical protein JWZ97_03365 [Methylococcus sp. EFPC2]
MVLAKWVPLAAFALHLAACVAPATLERATLAYDQSVTDLTSRQLLLNIARAHQHLPIHFTGVANIAASYNFQFSAGATPALTGSSGTALVPVFGAGVGENPTISIVPMEGEEFTKRLLAPFSETKLIMLLRQGVDVDLLLRLMASEFRPDGEESISFHNLPADHEGYSQFRRVVLHLSSIQDRNRLYFEPLNFEHRWTLPADGVKAEDLKDLPPEITADYDAQERVWRLRKRVSGRILITNYDPGSLSEDERQRLHELADRNPPDEVAIDIRSGYPGGAWPIRGRFRLRSFHNALNFLGRGVAEESEYPVEPDPRTPPVRENPMSTLALLESDSEPDGVDWSVNLNGRYYAVRPEKGYPWNREAFRLLYQLFQMTMTELPRLGAPAITISK